MKNKKSSHLKILISFLLAFICNIVFAQTFYNSDGSIFEAKSHYPDFSWGKTNQYCMFSHRDQVLTPAEVDTVSARSSFVCIEKNHAMTLLGGAEYGTKHEVEAFKAVNPDTKVLFYFNTLVAYSFTQWTKNFWKPNIENYPMEKSFAFINDDGEMEPVNNLYWPYYDILNPEFREWWVDVVVEALDLTGADGVFMDAFGNATWLRPGQTAEMDSCVGLMMADLRASLPADKIMLANSELTNEYANPYLDAGFLEHYNERTLSKESMLEDWHVMLEGAKSNKVMVYRIGVEFEEGSDELIEGMTDEERDVALEALSQEKEEFFLVTYLIGAQPYCFFQYGWDWNTETGPLVDYPLLRKKTGAPLGAYVRTNPTGWEFTREFEYASVWVNTETREGVITWYPDGNPNVPDECSGTGILVRTEVYGNTPTSDLTIVLKLEDSIIFKPQIVEDEVTGIGDGVYTWEGPNSFSHTGRVVRFEPVESSDFGVYTLTYQSDTCIYEAEIELVLDNVTSVKSELENQTSIYPNPANEVVYLLNSMGAQFTVYNTMGELLIENTTDSNEHSINLEGYSTGIYIINVMKGTHVERFQVVKK